MQKNTLHSLGILIGALGAAAYSCSPSVEQGPGTGLGATGSTSGGSSSANGGTSGANSATGGSSNSSSGGSSTGGSSNSSSGGSLGSLDIDASMSDAATMVDEDAACGKGEANGTLKDVNMFVMYDRSWSMLSCADSNSDASPPCTETDPTTRWDATSKALKEFFADPLSGGLRVALRFFPDDNPAAGCDGYTTMGGPPIGGTMGGRMGGFGGMSGIAGAGSTGVAGSAPNCDINACAQPLVDINPLTADPAPTDTQEAALIAAIDASPPPGGAQAPNPNPSTPTSAALAGAVQWATTYQTANPNSATVIVLVTDGNPKGCDESPQNIAAIAANGLKAGIKTYVIGLGGLASTTLNGIAMSGGTDTAFVVSSGSTSTELRDDLLAIRGKAISCNIDIPKVTKSGEQIDPTQINISYTDNSGTKTDYGLVEGGQSACGDALGWYFDDPKMPTQAILCPAACTQVQNDQTKPTDMKTATLSVLAGCKPHVITR